MGRDVITHQRQCIYNLSFNPHARVGRDMQRNKRHLTSNVSIHTPVWGVTIVANVWRLMWNVSIHTPVWGVTYYH